MAILESNWLDNWFSELQEVNDVCATKWKEAWIRIYGVPLKSWAYENFFNIGCVFGRVVSVDYSSFEYARVNILTDCLFNINCKLIINVEGKKSKIFIVEEPPKSGQPSIKIPAPPLDESSDDEDTNHSTFLPPKGNNYSSPSPNKSINKVSSPTHSAENSKKAIDFPNDLTYDNYQIINSHYDETPHPKSPAPKTTLMMKNPHQ